MSVNRPTAVSHSPMNPRIRAHILVGGLTLLLGAQLLVLARQNHASWETFREAIRPGGGRSHAVTRPVLAASDLLALLSVEQFDLAPEFGGNPYFTERMTEFNYPMRLRPGARLVLAPAAAPYLDRPGIVVRTNEFVIYERADTDG